MGDDRQILHSDVDFEAVLRNIKQGKLSPFLNKIYQALFSALSHDGVKVVEKDWEYLVVLDACRYDVFEKVNFIEGELSKKTSQGSSSEEWLNENFPDFYENIINVSANPYVTPTDDGGFRSNDHFPASQVYSLILDDEMQENGVVAPEKLTEKALSIARENEDKRIIIHYMQPHIPYIGNPSFPEGTVAEVADEVGDDKLEELYVANLRRVLESVQELKQNLSGRIVITADHGEMLGEYGLYGHYPGVYFDELVEVPWLETQGEKDTDSEDFSDLDY